MIVTPWRTPTTILLNLSRRCCAVITGDRKSDLYNGSLSTSRDDEKGENITQRQCPRHDNLVDEVGSLLAWQPLR